MGIATMEVLFPYLFGIILPQIITSQYLTFAVMVVVFAFVIKIIIGKNNKFLYFVMLSLILYAISTSYSGTDLKTQDYYNLIDNPGVLTGEICDMPYYNGDCMNYVINMKSMTVSNKEHKISGKCYVLCKSAKDIDDFFVGDTIQIQNAVIKPPADTYNESDFDYGKYLASKNIFCLCNTESYNISKTDAKPSIGIVTRSICVIKSHLIDTFNAEFAEPQASIVKSVLLGYKYDLDDETKDNFSIAGISHVLAVSGLHFTSILLYFSIFINKITLDKFYKSRVVIKYMPDKYDSSKRRYKICAFLVNEYNIKAIINIILIIFLMIFTGMSASVKRAGTMAIIIALSDIFGRRAKMLNSLAVAVFVILFVNPFSIYDLGFILSVFATLGIVLFAKPVERFFGKINKRFKTINEIVSVTISAQIFTIPILVLSYNKISLLCVLANLIVVPIMPYLLLFSVLFGIFSSVFIISNIFAGLTFLMSSVILLVAKFIASIPFASIVVSNISLFETIILMVVAVAIVVAVGMGKLKIKHRVMISTMFIMISIVIVASNYFSDSLYVTFLNVGQGDCSIVRMPNKEVVVIDGGGANIENSDTGKKYIIPYLKTKGIVSVDYAVMTHFHDDHCEGILSLMENYNVKNLIVPEVVYDEYIEIEEKALEIAEDKGINIIYFSDDEQITFGDVVIEAVSPEYNAYYEELNNTSLVLKLMYNDTSFLFTGDIEKEAEEDMLDEDIDSTVLKVAHHGSNTSSTEEFISRVSPEYAVISVGKNNVYKHPHSLTLNKLKKADAKIYRTDLNGSIEFNVDERGIKSIQLYKGDNFK